MYGVVYTPRMKKDVKRLARQGKDIGKLETVIETLAAGAALPQRCEDHPLKGAFSGYRGCHIEPDWILIYAIDKGQLILTAFASGSHAYLYGL